MDYEKQLKNTLADAHFRIATASEAHLQEMKVKI